LLRRDSADVTSANLPTSLQIARIVLILKAELFLRTTALTPGHSSMIGCGISSAAGASSL
jgi:hypothetical protein